MHNLLLLMGSLLAHSSSENLVATIQTQQSNVWHNYRNLKVKEKELATQLAFVQLALPIFHRAQPQIQEGIVAGIIHAATQQEKTLSPEDVKGIREYAQTSTASITATYNTVKTDLVNDINNTRKQIATTARELESAQANYFSTLHELDIVS